MDYRLPICAFLLTTTALPAANISWIIDASDVWETSINWSTGTIPSVGDDVTINQPSNITVSINSAAQANTLNAQNNVSVDSGSLTIFSDATFDGELNLADLTTLRANSGNIFADGVANFNGGNLDVINGGYIEATNLTNYQAYTGFVASKFESDGDGSTLFLDNLSNITGNTAPSAVMQINATNGGHINLSNLLTVDSGKVKFEADGTDSLIDLSSFQSLNHTGNTFSGLQARNGGEIMLPISGVDLVRTNLYLDSISILDVAAIENYNGGTATIDGTSAIFSGLANADGTGFVALNGAQIDLGVLTDYNGSTAALYTDFTADGFGSAIYMDNVATITGNTFASTRTDFQATNGGEIDLSGTQTIDLGGTSFFADGTGSLINLDSLTSITNTVNIGGIMEAINGGEIRFSQSNITAQKIALLIDGTGIFDHSAFSEWRDGTIAVDGITESFSSMTNINGTNILANNGAALSFPNITDYAAYTGFVVTNVAASDTSSIDLSNVLTMTGNTAASTRANFIASGAGASIDLSSLTTVNPSKTSFSASGSGSVVTLTSLSSMSHSGNSTSFLSATDGGVIQFGSASPVLNDVSLYIDNGGTMFSTGALSMIGGTFGGSGTLNASLAIQDGFVAPGTLAGQLSVSDNLEIGSGTVYAWDLANEVDNSDGTAGTDWDIISANNIQFLTSTQLELAFVDINDPDSGAAFWNLAHTWTIASATLLLTDVGLNISNPDFLQGSFDITSSSSQMLLNFTPVPEPSTYILMALGSGLIGAWFWRRRRNR